ncbi:MAG: hypothetical protein AAFQ94_22750 [Bacteroidota bacterium]
MKNLDYVNKSVCKAILILLLLSASGIMSCTDDEEAMNTPPIANGGPDFEIPTGVSITLDGTGSSDPDGDPLVYNWSAGTIPTGAVFNLTGTTADQAIFSASTPGVYVIILVVNDLTEVSEPDEVVITVTAGSNQIPTAVIVDENGQEISQANDNDQININSALVLSGAQSLDPENGTLSFLWTVIDSPAGSNPTIDNPTNEVIAFTPDIIGEYAIQLTVRDVNDTEGIALVLLTAVSSPIIINTDVTTDTVWEDVYEDPSLPDYQIINSIDVSAFLTIEAGVNVIIDEDVSVSVTETGGFDAQGTAMDSVTFTSSDIGAGQRWKGLYVNSSDARNSLSYVSLSWAGNSGIGFGSLNTREIVGLGVDDNGKMSLKNSTFMNNQGFSVYFDDGGGAIETFSNNAFKNYKTAIGLSANEVGGLDGNTSFVDGSGADVQIFATTLSEGESSIWPALNNATYFIPESIRISGQLTIEAGAVFEMGEDVFWRVDGSIDVNGTSSDHVVFTSSNVAAQIHWGGLFIESANALNSFDFAEILFAGGTTNGYGPINTPIRAALGVDYLEHKVSLTNSIISDSEGYGLFVDSRGGELETFANNTFTNNVTAVGLPANEVDALDGTTMFSDDNGSDVEILSTTYSETKTTTWPALNDAEYFVSGRLTIAGNLSIDAGAIFEMEEDVFWVIDGSLDVNGTATDHVVFTTSNLAGQINWGGIFVQSSSALNVIDFAEIRYGGGAEAGFGSINRQRKAAVGVDNVNGAFRLTLTNSIVSDSEGYGVYSIGIINDIESTEAGNTFANNSLGNEF